MWFAWLSIVGSLVDMEVANSLIVGCFIRCQNCC